MSWLRIDDAAVLNGKLGDLSDAEWRSLFALWSYCARKRNGGMFELGELRHAIYTTPSGPKFVRPQHIGRFLELGLVATDDGAVFSVNDWARYQPRDPTAADRMRRLRERTTP